MASEAETQALILREFSNHPRCCLWRANTGAVRLGSRFVRFGIKGQTDLMGVLLPTGRALFIEVKSATGRLRPEQDTFRRLVQKFGALWILARSVEDVRSGVGSA